MDLKQSREQIDLLDEQIVRLMIQRMDLMEDVVRYKEENNLPVEYIQREQQVLEHALSISPQDYADSMKLLYSAVFDICRDKQYRKMYNAEEHLKKVAEITCTSITDNKDTRVLCQGVEGAYAHIAAKAVFKNADIAFEKTWKDVFEQVQCGKADYGVLPIENSTAGSVNEVYDLMSHYNCFIAKAVKLRIDHCLVACEGTEIGSVKKILSHPQALSQCSHYTEELNAVTQAMPNTAVAAEFVSKQKDKSLAAIASRLTAELYGLKVLDSAVQNAGNNYTRFIVISRKMVLAENADRISLSMVIPHTAGSLNRVLMRFASYGLNLTKLESRPIPNTNFEFQFYFDLEGSLRQEKVVILLNYLSKIYSEFHFLGNYDQICADLEEDVNNQA